MGVAVGVGVSVGRGVSVGVAVIVGVGGGGALQALASKTQTNSDKLMDVKTLRCFIAIPL